MVPATIRAGGWPPTLGWNPDLELAYHHGPDLLVGLLTPPTGPDLAFSTELLGAYAWTALVLLTAALLLRSGSWAVTLALLPLLLAHGAWSLVFGEQPTLLKVPVPIGVPEAGFRAALGEIYWPAVELPWSSEQHAVPPNIRKPQFPLTYALAFISLERVSAGVGRSWSASLTLAGLIGFLGLVDETVAPVVLMLWIVVQAHAAWKVTGDQHARLRVGLRAVAGPLLAALFLAVGGGRNHRRAHRERRSRGAGRRVADRSTQSKCSHLTQPSCRWSGSVRSRFPGGDDRSHRPGSTRSVDSTSCRKLCRISDCGPYLEVRSCSARSWAL